MTRPITKRFLVRTLNRVARIAYNLECNEKFAASLVKSGLKSKRFRYLGSYLSNLAYLMQRFEPVTSESRSCVVCGKTFTAQIDHPAYATRRYCSNNCRQSAHRKRHAPDPSDKPRMATHTSVTYGE
jgi:hypothetical protein